eukprot:3473571-Pleurochrysis_carterae.AAC.5
MIICVRSNRGSTGSSEAVPLRLAPPTSGIVNIYMVMGSFNTAYAALPNSFAIRTRRYGGAASVPLGRVAGGVHGVVVRLCGPCDQVRCCAIVWCVEWSNSSSFKISSLATNHFAAEVLRRSSRRHGGPADGDQRGRPPRIWYGLQ